MSLSNPHIECFFVSAGGTQYSTQTALARAPLWSERGLATSTPSSHTAPNSDAVMGSPVFRVHAAGVDIFVAVGKTPDPTQAVGDGGTASRLIRAGASDDIVAQSGDRIAWVAA